LPTAEPETVKAYLASAKTSEGRKRKLVEDLSRFYKFKNIPFDRPRYKKTEKIPFIPLETEVEQLVLEERPHVMQSPKHTNTG